MMQIDVKLYGALRDHLPREQRGKATLEVAPDTVVQDVLKSLGIDKPVIVAVNEEHDIKMTRTLQSGDRMLVFEYTAGG